MKILYVPNESGKFRQVGFRRPLANLRSSGLVSDVSVFSLQWRIRNGVRPSTAFEQLETRVREFQPDVMLMQHLGGTGLTASHFDRLRRAARFDLIYHEADPYDGFLHPLPRAARAAGRAADVVFTVGSGAFAANFRRAGARDVRFESHCFEPERYRRAPVDSGMARQFDVVIVANRNSPRLRGHPNWRDRIGFVDELERRLGERLAVFGKNWSGPSARGEISFDDQQSAIRSAWISANWDHYAKEPSYFSNRLPISLAAGSIHATTAHPRYNEIFPAASASFLITSRAPHGLCDEIEEYLDRVPVDQRIEAQQAAQDYAYARFRQDDQIVRMLNHSEQRVNAAAAAAAWDLDEPPLEQM